MPIEFQHRRNNAPREQAENRVHRCRHKGSLRRTGCTTTFGSLSACWLVQNTFLIGTRKRYFDVLCPQHELNSRTPQVQTFSNHPQALRTEQVLRHFTVCSLLVIVGVGLDLKRKLWNESLCYFLGGVTTRLDFHRNRVRARQNGSDFGLHGSRDVLYPTARVDRQLASIAS